MVSAHMFSLKSLITVACLLSTQTFIANATGDAAHACRTLQSQLSSSVVVVANDAAYAAAISNARNQFNTKQMPACVVNATNAKQVEIAMKEIFYSKVRYTVQSGGHSGNIGWNNVDNGVLILMNFANKVTLNKEKNTVTILPGARFADTLPLNASGISVAGGRLNDIGTGLILGGGLNYLGPSKGFACDLLVEADVVLVNGTTVTAKRDNEHADLFVALKGGANRFGIVTRFEVEAVQTGNSSFFGGVITYPDEAVGALMDATARFVRDTNDPNAALLVLLVYSIVDGVQTPFHAVTIVYQGTELPQEIYGDFLKIPSIFQAIQPLNYAAATSLHGPGDDKSRGQLFGAAAFTGETNLYRNAATHWKNYTDTFAKQLSTSVLAFTPVLVSQIAAGREKGGNAIDPPLQSYSAVQFYNDFPVGVLRPPSEALQGRLLALNQMGRSAGFPLYINECDSAQNVFETYGKFEFLKQTYKKYDPTRFNIEFTDGPLGL